MVYPGMEVDALIWVLLPVFVAAGSALLSYSIMHARMEVAVARERALLAEAHASVNTYKVTLEDRVRAAQEESRRKALDDFMQEFRIEERHYTRENTSASMHRKTMVLQERLYFRNVPLSNWVEHELTMEENTTRMVEDTASDLSALSKQLAPLGGEEITFRSRLIR
jgi:hypothetical protein